MNEELLNLVSAKTKSSEFRTFVGQLLERRKTYEAIKARKNQIGKELRAKREGITVQQIEEESRKAVEGYALRDDEKNRISENRRHGVQAAKDNARLLRMILTSHQVELDHQKRWLNWEQLPSENKPLHQELMSFLAETRTLIIAFAESKGWSTTPVK